MAFMDMSRRAMAITNRRCGNSYLITGDETVYQGVLHHPTEAILDGQVMTTDYVLEVAAEDAAGTPRGTTITVDGAAFVSRMAAQPMGDGALWTIALEKV
jgi:hypothetical protein